MVKRKYSKWAVLALLAVVFIATLAKGPEIPDKDPLEEIHDLRAKQEYRLKQGVAP